MKKIKKGDPAIVISGKHKGKVSVVKKVDGGNIYLKGVNEVKSAVKGKGFIKKLLPIHISNIAYYNEKEKKGSRIGIIIDKDGKKKRILKKFKDIIVN